MRPGYFIKKAFTGMRNALLVNVVAVVTIAASLTIFGTFLVALINANELAKRWGTRLEITAYLKDGISDESLTLIEDGIKMFPEVKIVRYISKDDALKFLKRGLAEDSAILDGLDENPLPASLVIRLKDEFQNSSGLKKVAEKLKGIDSIEDLQYGKELTERFSFLVSIIRLGGTGLGIALALSIMLIVSSAIRLTLQARMPEVEVMRLVGATPMFIKAPFFIEGFALGTAGAMLATALLAVVKLIVENSFGRELNLLFGSGFDLLPYQAVMYLLSCGAIFGLTGSVLSFWRFAKID